MTIRQVHDLKKIFESQRKEINDCRAEIASLKLHIDGSGKDVSVTHSVTNQSQAETRSEDAQQLENDVGLLKYKSSQEADATESMKREEGRLGGVNEDYEPKENDNAPTSFMNSEVPSKQTLDDSVTKPEKEPELLLQSLVQSGLDGKGEHFSKNNGESSPKTHGSGNLGTEPDAEKVVRSYSLSQHGKLESMFKFALS